MGDVSYSAPSTFGYTHPSYWRFTFWGTLGMLECNVGSQTVAAYFDGKKSLFGFRSIPKTPSLS